MRANDISRLFVTTSLLAILTACGGGGGGASLLGGGGSMGGGGGSSAPGAQIVLNEDLIQSDPATFMTSEYNRTSSFGGYTGLAQINAAQAYGMGATGSGVTVAVVDTGIDADNVEFVGAISNLSKNIVTGSMNQADLQGINPHGTWVAGVIGARKNNTYTHGVAFNSTLMVLKSDTVTSGCPTGCFAVNHLVDAVNYASANGARVVNMSLGAQGSLGPQLETAIRNAVTNNVLVVAAAGNAGLNSVDAPANLGGTSGIAGGLLAVGAVDSNNVIASWSNRAGSAKNWYLVAPGQNVLTTDEAGMALVAGTSFAAPMVSGAAALVMEYAPYLTNKQVAEILLRTATDLGAAGVDDVYGHGLLNVGAALQPVGETSVQTSGGSSSSTGQTSLALGSAFGDALAGNHALQSAVMFDEYGRAFGFNMAGRVQNAGYTSNLSNFLKSNDETVTNSVGLGLATALITSFTADDARMVRDLDDRSALGGEMRLALSSDISDSLSLTATHGYGIGQAFGLTADDSRTTQDIVESSAFGNSYLNMVEGGNATLAKMDIAEGLALQVATGMSDKDGDRSAYAASLNYTNKTISIGVTTGMVNEADGALGTSGNGALAFGSGSTTQFVGATASINLRRGLTLAASYTMGQTDIADNANSLISDFKDVRSDSFAVALMADSVVQADDRLTLAVSQPVRITSGSANLNVATGVDGNGNAQYTGGRVGLTPTARQIDMQAAYAMTIGKDETLGISTVGTLNPGHSKDAGPAISVGLRYTKKF